MGDWSCRTCHGDGMRWSEERHAFVVCSCPAGQSKRRWLEMTPEQQKTERRRRERSQRKKRPEKEPLPF